MIKLTIPLVSFIDFETRSKVKVKDVGAWKYARHPSTLPLMVSWTTIGDVPHKWRYDLAAKPERPQIPEHLANLIEHTDYEFHAHNAGFEIAIWSVICRDRWGWPDIPLDRWHCTAAKGSIANQPRALGNLCKRLGTDERKDDKGKDLLNRLAVAQKAIKTYKKKGVVDQRSIRYLEEQGVELFPGKDPKALYYWDENEEALDALLEYNAQDTVAESEADAKLPKMSEAEREIWLLDQKINARGIPIDRPLCIGAMEIYQIEVDRCNEELTRIAYDPETEEKKQVTKTTQRERIVDWMNKRHNFGDSLTEDVVDEWLDKLPADSVDRRILELRQIAGGSAVKKYAAALQFAEDDDLCRGQLLHYGAATGRWAGKGIQPHNFKRTRIPDEIFFEAITSGDYNYVADVAEMFDHTVVSLLAQCVRGLIKARPGRKLVVSDFAGIEARVLQWLAKCQKALDIFRAGEDVYVHAAADVFEIPYGELIGPNGKIKPEYSDKRQIGKVCVLALGYGMGVDRFIETCLSMAGMVIDYSFAEDVVGAWRQANPRVVELWRRLENSCKAVIRNKKIKANLDGLLRVYWDKRGYLCIELPSKRVLYYYQARIDNESRQIVYRDGQKAGYDGKGSVKTYGGKLVENVDQAISRDLLCHSMLEAAGRELDLVFHVHDELVIEADEDDSTAFDSLHECMTSLPDWATDLPLAAETHEATRYNKF